MERKIITIRRRTGNGLTRCDNCDVLTWDSMTYDFINEYYNNEMTFCSQCKPEIKKYWLEHGYIVKESTIDG